MTTTLWHVEIQFRSKGNWRYGPWKFYDTFLKQEIARKIVQRLNALPDTRAKFTAFDRRKAR